MKVLLVDDEQKFGRMLAKRLELRGIVTSVYFAGEKALDQVKQGEHFDVAILDVKMPGIGGIELKQKLGELDPKMKFIFLTGHGSRIDEALETDEVVDYLPKPMKIEDLMEILNRLAEELEGTSNFKD